MLVTKRVLLFFAASRAMVCGFGAGIRASPTQTELILIRNSIQDFHAVLSQLLC